MKIDLGKIAVATGGTLVVAAGKKAAKPNLQHHKTFGVKKPKLPSFATTRKNFRAKYTLNDSEQKLQILNRRNTPIDDVIAKKTKTYAKAIGWLKSAGFVQDSATEFAYHAAPNITCAISFGINSSDVIISVRVDFNVITTLTHEHQKRFAFQKLTKKNVADLVSWLTSISKIKVPKQPKFLL